VITNSIEREYRDSEPSVIPSIRNFFDPSIISGEVRSIIDQREFTELVDNPMPPIGEFNLNSKKTAC